MVTHSAYMLKVTAGDVVMEHIVFRDVSRAFVADSLTTLYLNDVTAYATPIVAVDVFSIAMEIGSTPASVDLNDIHIIVENALTVARGIAIHHALHTSVSGYFMSGGAYAALGVYLADESLVNGTVHINHMDVIDMQGFGVYPVLDVEGMNDEANDLTVEITDVHMQSPFFSYTTQSYAIEITDIKTTVVSDVMVERFAGAFYYANTDGSVSSSITMNNFTASDIYYTSLPGLGVFGAVFRFEGDSVSTDVILSHIAVSQYQVNTAALSPISLCFIKCRTVVMTDISVTQGGPFLSMIDMALDMTVSITDVVVNEARAHANYPTLIYLFPTLLTNANTVLSIHNMTLYCEAAHTLSGMMNVIRVKTFNLTKVHAQGQGAFINFNTQVPTLGMPAGVFVDVPASYDALADTVATVSDVYIDTRSSTTAVMSATVWYATLGVSTASLYINHVISYAKHSSYWLQANGFANFVVNDVYINGGYGGIHSTSSASSNGLWSVTNAEIDSVSTMGVFLLRNSATLTAASKFFIDNVYMHDSYNIQYATRITNYGVGTISPDSGISNVVVRECSYPSSASGGIVAIEHGATSFFDMAYNVNNITIENCYCLGASVAINALFVKSWSNLNDIIIRNVTAKYIFRVEMLGDMKRVASHWSNIHITQCNAYVQILKVAFSVSNALYTNYIYPTSANISVWCNHVASTTMAAGFVYARSPFVLNIEKWGGNTFAPGVNKTNRHLFADRFGQAESFAEANFLANLATVKFEDVYIKQVNAVDYGGLTSIPIEGGVTMKLTGDWMTSFVHGIYGSYTATFRGVPVRDVKGVYDDEAYLVLGGYDESKYNSNEILLVDSHGQKGMICTDMEYSQSTSIAISMANYEFSGLGNQHCHAGLKALTSIIMTKFAGAPFVSIRCIMVVDADVTYGDWYTPSSSMQSDMYCWMPCDKVPVGVYSVKIQVLGNVMINIPVMEAMFVTEVHPPVVLEAVQHRYIINNKATVIHGRQFPDTASAMCRYTRHDVVARSEDLTMDVMATVLNMTTMTCTVPSLAAIGSPAIGSDIDLYVTFFGEGSGWYSVPRQPLKLANYIYYNFDYDSIMSPFVYMGAYTAKAIPAPLSHVHIPSTGWHDNTYSSGSSVESLSGMVHVDGLSMICMFESQDGYITFVKPSIYSKSIVVPTYAGVTVCDIPPSPGGVEQTTRVTIGYWHGFAHTLDIVYQYNDWSVAGALYHAIAIDHHVLFDSDMNSDTYTFYNCTASLCYCRYEYVDSLTHLSVSNDANPLAYNVPFDTFACTLPLLPAYDNLNVSLILNGHVMCDDVIQYAYQPDDVELDPVYLNGVFGSQILVTGIGFVDSDALSCGFALDVNAVIALEGSQISCAGPLDTAISHATYVNSTAVLCTFGSFFAAVNNETGICLVNPADSHDYVCDGGLYTVYAGNSFDDLIAASNCTSWYQLIDAAETMTVTPYSGNHRYIDNVIITGTNIASIGTPMCWWAELNAGQMPPSPDLVPEGLFSVILPGVLSSNEIENLAICPLPKINGVQYIGVVVSNDGRVYNASFFAVFEYTGRTDIVMTVIPSNITQNNVPLSVQPVLLLIDDVGNPMLDMVIEVVVMVIPAPVSVLGNIVTADPATGVATFNSLMINGHQSECYSVCFQATSIDSQSEWTCVNYTCVDACPNMMAHSVEHDLGCVCDVGYEYLPLDDVCAQCPFNYFRSNLSELSCLPCGDHMHTLGQGTTSWNDCKCDDNYMLEDDVCVLHCPSLPVFEGYSYISCENSTGDECTSYCASGYVGVPSSIICRDNGTWSSPSGCIYCPLGYYDATSESCTTVCHSSQTSCVTCSGSLSSSPCTSCIDGYSLQLSQYCLTPKPMAVWSYVNNVTNITPIIVEISWTNAISSTGSSYYSPAFECRWVSGAFSSCMHVSQNAPTWIVAISINPNNAVLSYLLTVPANAVTDVMGNSNEASSITIKYDPIKPTVDVSLSYISTTAVITMTFSETVIGFDPLINVDCDVQGASVLSTNASCDGLICVKNVDLSACSSPDGCNVSCHVPGDVAYDDAGNGNAASQEKRLVFGYVYPVMTKPTFIGSPVVNGTTKSPIPMIVEFNKFVVINASRILLVNAILDASSSDFTVYNDTFILYIKPVSSSEIKTKEPLAIDIRDGAGIDKKGEISTGSFHYTIVFDHCASAGLYYDCQGVCNGSAVIDLSCDSQCTGGTTGREYGSCQTAESTTFEGYISSVEGLVTIGGSTVVVVGAFAVVIIIGLRKRKSVVLVMSDSEFQAKMAESNEGDRLISADLPTIDNTPPTTTDSVSSLINDSDSTLKESHDRELMPLVSAASTLPGSVSAYAVNDAISDAN